MRLLLTFIIFILGGFYTFGKENCCGQCCEYLRNCCKKGKGEVQEEFYLKKAKAANSEEIKKLVNTNWYNYKGKNALFFLYEKINSAENQNINENDVIKVKKDKNGFSIDKDFITEEDNTKKWALFEIIYGEGKEEVLIVKTLYLYCSDIENLGDYSIFRDCQQHISISVIACDTSGVTDMHFMFSNCKNLKNLDLSKFDTKNVTNMSNMFSGCEILKNLNLSNFDTKKVTDMFRMFSGCYSLQELNLSKFNTDNVTNMSGMFSNCSFLTKLNLPNFNTETVTNMSFMFFGCKNLKNLNLSNFDTKNVTNMSNMFSVIPYENLNSFTLPDSLSKLINNK